MLTAALVVVLVIYVLQGVYQVLVVDTKRYSDYWRELAKQPVKPGDVRVIALGDSTFQAIGAKKPQRGTVGRVVTYLEDTLAKNVHITNLSVSGARAEDVAHAQLFVADFAEADLVLVAVGANDALQGSDYKLFQQAIEQICQSLPHEKTIMADVALVKGRDQYQTILEECRSAAGIEAAHLEDSFAEVKKPWKLTARDFFHPSDYGYKFWFAAFVPALDKLITSQKLAK